MTKAIRRFEIMEYSAVRIPVQHFHRYTIGKKRTNEHGDRGDRMPLAHVVGEAAALPHEDVRRIYRRPGPPRAGAQRLGLPGGSLHEKLPPLTPGVRRARVPIVQRGSNM
jgi:hypothetical protein